MGPVPNLIIQVANAVPRSLQVPPPQELLQRLSRCHVAYFFSHVVRGGRKATGDMVRHFNSFFPGYQVVETEMDDPTKFTKITVFSVQSTVGRGRKYYY